MRFVRQLLALPAALAAASLASAQAAVTPPSTRADSSPIKAMTPARRTALGNAPGSAAVATLEPGARIEPIARDRGWVKVSVEGWVREADLVVADTSIKNAVTAADLRANPDAWRGKTVRWDVQVISYQLADALRRELTLDEPYLLARGPGADNSLLYLALPATLADAGSKAAKPPMKRFIVTARVRSARSEPSGVPILDVLTLTPR